MKHLIRYNGYTSEQRTDDILDKISKYGIDSLRENEKIFLDAYHDGNYEEIHKQMIIYDSNNVFVDENEHFKFEYLKTEKHKNELYHIGVIYVPDLVFRNGKKVAGRLMGRIKVSKENTTTLEFTTVSKNGKTHDISEFCNAFEYELDVFIDYIISELIERLD